MTKGIKLTLAALIPLAMASAAHADETISLKLGYQNFSPSGTVAAEVAGFGTEVNLENDLGLDDSDSIMAEAAVAFGDFKLTVGYLPLSFEGNTTLNRSILFDGKLFFEGVNVASEVELDIIDAGLTYYFLNFDDTPTRFQLGAEVSAKIVDVDASINDTTFGMSTSASETLPFPTVGLRGRVAFSDYLGLNGRVGYIGYDDNHFLDTDVQVEVSPIPLLGFYAGYRYLDVEIDESDILLDSDFSGFYGGALFRF